MTYQVLDAEVLRDDAPVSNGTRRRQREYSAWTAEEHPRELEAGAVAFGKMFGLDPVKAHKDGTGRRVFWTINGKSIDIKITDGRYLIRKVGAPHADILVLAKYNAVKDGAKLVGWLTDDMAVTYPLVRLPDGEMGHKVWKWALNPISSLCVVIGRRIRIFDEED